ncbi:FAD-binding oxidoreductase [Candidatus Saccharibacteria bacterium]|nr:FAD-binding oxidoreductase [Candidatus Saccharibacteria bacterium]
MGIAVKHLNKLITGNAFDSPKILKKYSKDASSLTIPPVLVVFPESVNDIKRILNFAIAKNDQRKSIPVTVRGSGQSTTGAALSEGIVISTAKLDKLLDIDARERLVRVQPGLTIRELNKILSVNGLCIPVYGHDDDTIGGLISTAPVDPYSSKYRGITKYIRKLEIILPDGSTIKTHRVRRRAVDRKITSKSTEGILYRDIRSLLSAYSDTIDKISRDHIGMAGYPNITKVANKHSLNLTPLFFGAEGTLGIIAEITLKAVPKQKKRSRVVAIFHELHTARHFLDTLSSLRPRRLEIYDNKFIHTAESTGKKTSGIINTVQKGYVVYAEFDEHRRIKLQKVRKLSPKLPSTARLFIESPSTKSCLDDIEQLINSNLVSMSNTTTIPPIKDIFIPAWNLSSFINDISLIEEALKLDLIFYGSYSTSNYHIIPNFDDASTITPQAIKKFYKALLLFIEREGGSIAGGTPEGRTKAPITNANLSTTERDLYLAIKHAFDPKDVLNPSAKLGASPDFAIDKLLKN